MRQTFTYCKDGHTQPSDISFWACFLLHYFTEATVKWPAHRFGLCSLGYEHTKQGSAVAGAPPLWHYNDKNIFLNKADYKTPIFLVPLVVSILCSFYETEKNSLIVHKSLSLHCILT